MRRDYIFWGVVLILLGGLMFLNATDIRLPRGISPMELFWPSLLILLGLWVLGSGLYRSMRKSNREE